jgi:hypothetical protein
VVGFQVDADHLLPSREFVDWRSQPTDLSEVRKMMRWVVGVEQWARTGPSLLEIAAPVLRHGCPKKEEEEKY